MDIRDFLAAGDVEIDVRGSDKVRLLQELSQRAAARLKLDPDRIARAILDRERLGSTGMGGGIAIPHARLQDLDKPFGILARLRRAIDFTAIDGKPVDLVFLLLLPAAPGGEQLNALASVTRKLRNAETTAALRGASDSAELYCGLVAD